MNELILKTEGFVKNLCFKTFYIAGFNYYEGAIVFENLKIGTVLDIVAENNNIHDEYALALYFDGKKLGFVPSDDNVEMSKLISLGYNIFKAVVQQISPQEHPARQVKIIVYAVGNEEE